MQYSIERKRLQEQLEYGEHDALTGSQPQTCCATA